MNNVKRYDMSSELGDMCEWPNGEYVLFTDYEKLQAENKKQMSILLRYRAAMLEGIPTIDAYINKTETLQSKLDKAIEALNDIKECVNPDNIILDICQETLAELEK